MCNDFKLDYNQKVRNHTIDFFFGGGEYLPSSSQILLPHQTKKGKFSHEMGIPYFASWMKVYLKEKQGTQETCNMQYSNIIIILLLIF